jgi:hypothetical protein
VKREEVKEVFKILKNVYPQFEITSEKLDIWSKFLSDQNPAIVMRNAERFVLDNKFPPSIADLRERKLEAYSTSIFDKMREWEKDATRKQ